MPSNKDLAKSIADACEALEIEPIDTKGMNNAELAETLSDLKAKLKDANLNTPADKSERIKEANEAAAEKAAKEEAAAAEALEEFDCVVCEGKSVTTKRGILSEGEGINCKDLAGGEKAMGALVEKKYVKVN